MLKTDRYTKIGWFCLIFGHFLTAYFSFGYHHPDEHFQILEWAHYRIGLAPDASYLPWEFAAQIRPWFQPFLHAVLMKGAILFGAYDPFRLAFLFRVIYAALNIWAILSLWNYFRKKYDLSTIWFAALSLLWFLPYVHARTSSENLAGIFLSFAFLRMMQSSSLRSSLVAGVLFGLAFLARYQIALGLVGLAVVLLLQDRGIRRRHWCLLAGFCTTLGLGVLLDRWGYGNWVFTPYQYFKVNLVDHVADRYNPYPWYQYFLWILQLNPLISLPLFFGWLGYCRKNPTHILTGFTAAFFLLHCFITNKEYRFLFPILNIVPFMAIVFFRNTDVRKLAIPFAAISILSFCISSLHGASTQTYWPAHAVYEHFEEDPRGLWLSNRDYLDVGHQHYYDLRRISGFEPHRMQLFQKASELSPLLESSESVHVLVDGSFRDPEILAMVSTLEAAKCSVSARAFPKIVSEKSKIPYQALYFCKRSR